MRDFLTDEQVMILREAHYSCRYRKSADRIKAVLLLNEGYSYKAAGRILMLDDSTMRRYEQQYEQVGIDGLLECRYIGSNGLLTTHQEAALVVHLRATTYLTVKEIVSHVQNTYDIHYSIEGMTHLLHRLGFVYKKSKHIPSTCNPQQQQEFIKQYEALKQSKQKEDMIYFMDASHPHHNSMLSYGWIYKGEIKTIKANTGRARLNLNGALNLERMEIVIQQEETINADAMINLLTALEQKQPQGIIYGIVDNARYNHAIKVRLFLQKHQRIKLLFLPAYSPNLNTIERLWRFFHQKILYNKYYETFDDFQKIVHEFFQNIGQYEHQLQTLLTDSFQTLSI